MGTFATTGQRRLRPPAPKDIVPSAGSRSAMADRGILLWPPAADRLLHLAIAVDVHIQSVLIPSKVEVIRTAIPMLMSGEILADVSISMVRVLVGFISGSLIGILFGVLLGRIRVLHELLDPIMELLRYLSPTAMITIAVIWFGIGEMSKYFLIFWGTFFIVVVNTTAGVWRAPVTRQRAAECLGANQLEIFLMVIIPSAVPYIVTGMRVAMASSFMSIIPAEILAADSGIGYLLQKSSLLLQTNRIFVALLTICLLGFVVDRIFRFLVERVLTRYMSYVSVT
jgi:NitT/TauT family transport system permease protein/taurine transport system permease protein